MNRIKEFREQNGWTQTELADKTGLSLRTIQRVESGRTIPKGHTLKVLSELFGVKPSEFKSKNTQITFWHIEQLKNINLSALSVILIPFGNILFPFMVWRRNKDDQIINLTGRYILNFQIIWSLVLSFLLLASPFVQNALNLPFSLIIVVLILSYCFNIFIIFKFSSWISKGDLERLNLTYQLL